MEPTTCEEDDREYQDRERADDDVLAQDAYYDYLDALQDRGSDERALTFEEFRRQPRAIAPSYEVDPTDDFPF